MSKRFLVTKIPTINEEEAEKFEAVHGRKPSEADIPYSWAETVIDLLEVSAVREQYDDNNLREDEAVIYLYGQSYFIQSPYQEVKKQWIELSEATDISLPSAPDLGKAVETLARALDEDKSEGSLYFAYQGNIAMAFVDAWAQQTKHIRSSLIFLSALRDSAASSRAFW